MAPLTRRGAGQSHLSLVIRHWFLMLNHVHETPDINIGPENA
jgi:hypothetical protein